MIRKILHFDIYRNQGKILDQLVDEPFLVDIRLVTGFDQAQGDKVDGWRLIEADRVGRDMCCKSEHFQNKNIPQVNSRNDTCIQ